MLILAIWGDRPVMKTVDKPRGSQVLQVISRANCLGLEIGLNRPDNAVTISGRQRQDRLFARETVDLRRARPLRIKRQRCTWKSHGKEGQNSCSQHALNIARFICRLQPRYLTAARPTWAQFPCTAGDSSQSRKA